jgi:hypothetical protein
MQQPLRVKDDVLHAAAKTNVYATCLALPFRLVRVGS